MSRSDHKRQSDAIKEARETKPAGYPAGKYHCLEAVPKNGQNNEYADYAEKDGHKTSSSLIVPVNLKSPLNHRSTFPMESIHTGE